MTSTSSLFPTAGSVLNSVDSAILSGSTASNRASITDAAGLQDAIASQLFGLGNHSAGSTSTDDLSPLLSDVTDSSALKDVIAGAFLGASSDSQTVATLAGLGSTLNQMAQTAQSALSSASTTVRDQALSRYQSLYDSLNQSAVSLDGNAGNAATLGISAPGAWSDAATGTAAVSADMTAVVKAHTAVQEMIQSAGNTLIQSYLLG